MNTPRLWVPFRQERLEHDHIFQVKNGSPGCPACEAINPMHMTSRYAKKASWAVKGVWW